MKRVSSLLVMGMLSGCAYAVDKKPIVIETKKVPLVRIAVIDTGLDVENPHFKKFLCKDGHEDFTGTSIKDTNGHGSHISGLINKYADSDKYCQIILKFYDERQNGQSQIASSLRAFNKAIQLKVDVINYSAGGTDPSKEEKELIELALKRGIRVVVAAGNEQCELGEPIQKPLDNNKCSPGFTKTKIKDKYVCQSAQKCEYYPAMYNSKLIIVGNLDQSRKPAKTSNTGKHINTWEIGSNIRSFCKDGEFSCTMSGTSQATAIKAGKIVNSLISYRIQRKSKVK